MVATRRTGHGGNGALFLAAPPANLTAALSRPWSEHGPEDMGSQFFDADDDGLHLDLLGR